MAIDDELDRWGRSDFGAKLDQGIRGRTTTLSGQGGCGTGAGRSRREKKPDQSNIHKCKQAATRRMDLLAWRFWGKPEGKKWRRVLPEKTEVEVGGDGQVT